MSNPNPKHVLRFNRVADESVEELIRCRAYELYEGRGREDGHDVEDWLEAENEINKKTEPAAAA